MRVCPKESKGFDAQIIKECGSLITYDPNYTYEENAEEDVDMEDEEGGWGSEFDEDDMQNEDDDDTSWKVRRTAAKVIQALIQTRTDILAFNYQTYTKILVQRFKERDDNVKQQVLLTY